MTAMLMDHAVVVRDLRRFARTPKGLLLGILGSVVVIALINAGASPGLDAVLVSMTAAGLVDLIVQRAGRGSWVFPSGALLSGLIVAMVMSPFEPLIVPAAMSVLAVTTKHLIRVGPANVFNPAAIALVMGTVLFDAGQSWWGALADLGWAGLPVLLATGWFIADRINKLPLVLTFLGVYVSMFTAWSFVGDAGQVAEIFRSPDLHAVLFFALFMLDDPPTCPVKYGDQVTFAVVVAMAAFGFFVLWGWLYFLPAALLVGNGWEAWRRTSAARRRATSRAV